MSKPPSDSPCPDLSRAAMAYPSLAMLLACSGERHGRRARITSGLNNPITVAAGVLL
jgi:hypothetical protein